MRAAAEAHSPLALERAERKMELPADLALVRKVAFAVPVRRDD